MVKSKLAAEVVEWQAWKGKACKDTAELLQARGSGWWPAGLWVGNASKYVFLCTQMKSSVQCFILKLVVHFEISKVSRWKSLSLCVQVHTCMLQRPDAHSRSLQGLQGTAQVTLYWDNVGRFVNERPFTCPACLRNQHSRRRRSKVQQDTPLHLHFRLTGEFSV